MILKIKKNNIDRQKAFVIPVVILLSVVGLMFLMFLVNSMTQSKSQKLATTHTTKAYFMAQAGIQQMKLKYKLMPQESFNAGFVQYGFNPWYHEAIEDFTSGGDKFPIFLASIGEDITNRAVTKKGDPALVPGTDAKQIGGFKGMPFELKGFSLEGLDEDEDITEWGYDLVAIESGAVRYDPPDKPTIKEQTIEYTVIGYAKQQKGHLAKEEKYEAGEEFVKKWEAKETLIIKSRYTGKDYGN